MKRTSPFFKALLLGFCFILNFAGGLYAENEDAGEGELPQYWETISPNPRGVVLVVHGLNVRPSKMGAPRAAGTLAALFLDSGCHVYRAALKGHDGPLEDMRKVTQADWIEGAYAQYCRAKTRAENAGLPLYLAGFSLGALVYEVLMNEETAIPVRFEKAILFSPAVAIKPAAKTVLALQPFTRDTSIIKSVSPQEYRAQAGASIAAYKIVFNMEELLCAASFKKSNIDTLIFIDKKDEMVSSALLRKRIIQYGLTNWNVFEVSHSGAAIKPAYHHLLIDDTCVSAETWQYIARTIRGFLD